MRPLTRRIVLLAAAGLALGLAGDDAGADGTPVIAAAADLQFALAEVAAAFMAETGQEVRLTFGSSGNLYRQIREGAPFELYLSADEQFVLDLAKDGLAVDEGALYAVGRLALFVPHGSPLEADGTLAGLKAALAEGHITRFAIANPEHAPYGRRAEEVLRHQGLWEDLAPKLVLGENVSQAAHFAAAGDAQGGIIAYSLALAPDIAALGESALIPEAWHAPLRQRMALLRGHGRIAAMFFDFMQTKPARTIMRRYGFVLPGEAM
ncbi:MAG TPA: molybdate ABC transporter substrate-binding protein [Bauldia sp.]|nr:molybdate ABC transporter substrate-binding protein [Bauldia sp.]